MPDRYNFARALACLANPSDPALRAAARVEIAASEALAEGRVPLPIYKADRCEACSLLDLCRPQVRRDDVSLWLARRLNRAGVPE